ncbi:hypothetical protein [uncultured Sphaerochaeta sp.]|uniref:hypothetical protein n=1 Tax=uncultured Sphaerochaeta sp. TaxID=886478 RepID=UPI0029CA5423|nr:hypothetical protein [uncultured Sphaerochaeta sp.]
MTKISNKNTVKKGGTSRRHLLSGSQARQVLNELAEKDATIAKEIERLSSLIFCDVSVEQVASSVFLALDGIDIEECWNASGKQWGGGYRDEFDVADDMIMEALFPFEQKIDVFYQAGEYAAELEYLHGVLLGIYQLMEDSTSEFVENYMEDYPDELKQRFIDDWKKRHPEDADGLQKLNTFIEKHCPAWITEGAEL